MVFSVFAALVTAIVKLLGPGGVKGVVAENLILKQQLLILTRTRRRAPNLRPVDRFLLGLHRPGARQPVNFFRASAD